ELLSNTPGIVEPFAPFLVIGLVISGLESRSVPYHPQEVLAVTEVVCLEDSSSWQLGPLHEAIVRGMDDQALTRNLVLVCAGLLAGIADAIGTEADTLASRHRTALSEGMVGHIDWDALPELLARGPAAAERARDGVNLDLDELTNRAAHEQPRRGLRRSAGKRAGVVTTIAECATCTRWGYVAGSSVPKNCPFTNGC